MKEIEDTEFEFRRFINRKDIVLFAVSIIGGRWLMYLLSYLFIFLIQFWPSSGSLLVAFFSFSFFPILDIVFTILIYYLLKRFQVSMKALLILLVFFVLLPFLLMFLFWALYSGLLDGSHAGGK